MRGITPIISGSILGSLVLIAGGQSANAAVAPPALAAREVSGAHHSLLTKVWHRPWGWHAGPRWGWRQGLSYIADWGRRGRWRSGRGRWPYGAGAGWGGAGWGGGGGWGAAGTGWGSG
ncbi:MAG: hypothetical protein WBX25_06275, partial [Rhodomicrobium sp.]